MPTPVKKSNINSKASIKKPGAHPVFKPGTYPCLFDAATGSYPTIERPLIADWPGIADAAVKHHEIMVTQPAIEQKFLAGAKSAVDRFHRTYSASAVLCAAQAIVKTTGCHDKSTSQSNYMQRTGLVHMKTMRIIQNQSGLVTDAQTGEDYTYPEIDRQIKRGVRAAYNIYESNNQQPDIALNEVIAQAGESGLLPADTADPLFDLQLREALQDWFSTNNFEWINVPDDLPVLTGVNPPWWVIIPAPQQLILAPLFAARPVGQVAWLAWINALPVAILEALGIRGARAGAFNAWDLAFARNPKEDTNTILKTWASLSSELSTYVETADNTALPRDGSLVQLAEISTDENGISVFQDRVQRPATLASLFGLFPIRPNYLGRHRMKRNARYIAQRNLSLLRSDWVTEDLKK